jgi:nucleotide-binding universal stress UspA family protein
MTIKSILVAPIFESDIETVQPGRSLEAYAAELASANGAHLSILVGLCRLSLPSAGMVAEAQSLVAQANKEREKSAQELADTLYRMAKAAGVSASAKVITGQFGELCTRVLSLARTSDLTLMQPSDGAMSIRQGVLEEMLFNSGRPVVIVPQTANTSIDGKIVVAWDGSSKSARAIGDAMPFIERAQEVEIVTVEGDPNKAKQIEGSDIAPHISRHAHNVRLTNLTCKDGDVGRVISEHVSMTRADLLVMGAYGHSRLRQFILGGVTSSMIRNPPVPVLMSY